MQLPLGRGAGALSHPQSRADASVRITDATNTALPWSPSVCVWEKPAHRLLSHSRHIPQGAPSPGKPLHPSLHVCGCEGSPGTAGRLAVAPSSRSLPTPTPTRDSALSQEQASHPWSGQQQASGWDRNQVIPRPRVAEVEVGCLRRMPHGLCLHFPAQIFPKHKAFLFPLELLRNTHMLQSWEKETRRLK